MQFHEMLIKVALGSISVTFAATDKNITDVRATIYSEVVQLK